MTPEEKKEELEKCYDAIRRSAEHHKEVIMELDSYTDEDYDRLAGG